MELGKVQDLQNKLANQRLRRADDVFPKSSKLNIHEEKSVLVLDLTTVQ